MRSRRQRCRHARTAASASRTSAPTARALSIGRPGTSAGRTAGRSSRRAFSCPLAPPPFRPCLIPRDAALALERALPKKSRLPILAHALVDVAGCQDGVFRAVTTDLETTRPFEVRKLPEAFPDYRQILPRYRPLAEVLAALDARTKKTTLTVERLVKERACVEIGVSNASLEELMATLRKMDPDRTRGIRLRVPLDGASPLEMQTTLAETGQAVTLLLLPMRV